MSVNQPQISGVSLGGDDDSQEPPRQPSSLQGLLRFAMDATKAEDAPEGAPLNQIDDERKKFLEEALKSMTVNVMEIIHKNVQILRGADSLSIDSDITEYLNAFEEILEYVDRIDTAIDYHKIGGFLMFGPCFNSIHALIRAGACDILAEITQNNPYCQNVVTDTELLDQLLNLLDKDMDEAVQIKALYAISCNIRENPEGYVAFINKGGLNIVVKALQRPVDKLRTKSSFLLSCLCISDPDLKDKLVKMNTVPLLIGLIAEDRMLSHEHILSLLFQIVWKNADAKSQCLDARYNLKNILKSHLSLTQGKEECREEIQYCQSLLCLLFDGDSTETDR